MIDKQFILAGKSIVTIEIPSEHIVERPHYTFLIEKSEANANYPESWFAKLLTGPDNTSDYTYLGKLLPFDGSVQLTRKSTVNQESYVYRLLNRTLSRVWANDVATMESFGFRLHHEGKCGRCGRRLTTPESIECGIGPECRKQL